MKISSSVAAVACYAGTMLAPGVAAQSYPDKPVRVLVGLAPGGGTDAVARLLAQRLADMLGQSFIVDNRPAAGGNLATELAARALPDGHTLLLVSPTFAINPSVWRDLKYDAVRDFAPVVMVSTFQYFLAVRSSVPVNSARELIALAKAQPRQIAYASTGTGGTGHLTGELFKTMAGIDLVHIPYKGAGPAVTGLLAGEVQVIFGSSGGIVPHAKAGRLKALAVTGAKRTAIAPEIPTIAESGLPGFEVTGWYALLAPAKTPHAVITKLNAAANRALPELRERYAALGVEVVGGTPAELSAVIRSEIEKWSKVVKQSGARVE